MEKYKIKKEENGIFYVIENATEHVIKVFVNKSKANDFMKKLVKGFGFNGWTPAFFLVPKLKIVE